VNLNTKRTRVACKGLGLRTPGTEVRAPRGREPRRGRAAGPHAGAGHARVGHATGAVSAAQGEGRRRGREERGQKAHLGA
jgi:hypothetical protein